MRAFLLSFAVIASSTAAFDAKADDWGCQVLLCLSNPAGPKAVAECVPPINKLWKALARGKPFPTCDLGGGSDGTRAVQVVNYYPPCPAGSEPLPAGALIQTGAGLLRGFGDGSGVGPGADGGELPPLACVAGYRGTKVVTVDAADGNVGEVTVSQYAQVSLFPARGSGNVIDVYIDGKLFSRVPY